MPQVDVVQPNHPKNQAIALAAAGFLLVVIVGGVLALKFWPKDTTAASQTAIDRASQLKSSGKAPDGITILNDQLKVARTKDEKADLHLSLGTMYSSLKQYDDAIAEFQKTASLAGESYGTNNSIARASYKGGKTAAAIEYYQKNIDLIKAGKAPQHYGDLTDLEALVTKMKAGQALTEDDF